jgi:putative heme utilization carrier protein HutX
MTQKLSAETSARIRAGIAQAPAKMALQMARDLGVPEVEIVRHLPSERATELDASRWEEIFQELTTVGKVHVVLSNNLATMESVGEFGNLSIFSEFFNVQTDTLDMHIRFAQIAAIFAIVKPSHMTGIPTLSIQYFDAQGNAGFKVFLTFGADVPSPETLERFHQIREKYSLEGKKAG